MLWGFKNKESILSRVKFSEKSKIIFCPLLESIRGHTVDEYWTNFREFVDVSYRILLNSNFLLREFYYCIALKKTSIKQKLITLGSVQETLVIVKQF